MIDDLFQCILLFICILFLINIQLIQILYMFIFLFQFLIIFIFHIFHSIVRISDPQQQWFDFFFQSSTLGLEHLSHRCLLFYQLFDLIILVPQSCFQFRHFCLQTIHISLLVDFQLFHLRLVHFMQFGFQIVDFQLAESFSFQHFHSDTFILFSQQSYGFFEMSFMFYILRCQFLHFSRSCIQILFQSDVLSLDRIQSRKMISFQCFDFFQIVQL